MNMTAHAGYEINNRHPLFTEIRTVWRRFPERENVIVWEVTGLQNGHGISQHCMMYGRPHDYVPNEEDFERVLQGFLQVIVNIR